MAAKRRRVTGADPADVPARRQCGTMQVHHRLLEQDPGFRLRQAQIEARVAARMISGAAPFRAGLVTIPVAVHVVHRLAAERVSAAQVKSQIAALNKDYRAKNPDRSQTPDPWKGLVTDVQVEFVLASDGIDYVKTDVESFSDDDAVKSSASGGADPWPATRYLNLWVCTLGGGLLGYAQFPGGPAATDGVVILNRAFGTGGSATAPFDLGRTSTHEIGHWLNLRHIWGDTEDCSGSDFVSDTPNAQHPNYGKPGFPHVSCHNGPNGDMFCNYMDYVDDDAMCMFTAQQVVRMHATLDGPRSGLGRA